jgi:hypothetical protein
MVFALARKPRIQRQVKSSVYLSSEAAQLGSALDLIDFIAVPSGRRFCFLPPLNFPA